ncbi:MAG TPA: M1 family metallopeptidase [Myxococcaceae bacterium]|jgi:aminopeptidase N|nr:M1 family metallopeptidase [Myxococcaceae bacterium]
MARIDPHSWADDAQPRQVHLSWTAGVDFGARALEGTAELHFSRGGAEVDLDTRGLQIHSVATPAGKPLRHALGPEDPILGTRLRVGLDAGEPRCTVRYRTGPGATAVQWLEPEQTAGKRLPFLYTQCQAIHARSVVPIQDTPRLRLTYRASLTAPRELRALMAAAATGRTESGAEATESWAMSHPIPPYLLAFAVGALESRELGPRTRVWAEPSLVEAAAWEFAEVDRMLTQAEALLGPYVWGRFDVLVLPPSFPYGGMENPTLTFLTPTVLAGDRSLVNVLAHELSHSWTGNLVSNATAEDFWLNEGFTVFIERRILTVLEGRESVALHAAAGRQSLDDAVAGFRDRPALTRLRTRLQGVDPDDAYSQVPYEKGYLFLRALEEAAGPPAFDAFLRKYLRTFAFQSLTTEEFIAFLAGELPEASRTVDVQAWVDGEGIPPGAPRPASARLARLQALGTGIPPAEEARTWRPLDWQVYLGQLPRPTPRSTVEALDRGFGLTRARNPDVLVAFLVPALSAGYAPAVERAQAFLGEVGRMKYLKPLYAALAARAETRELAEACFQRLRAGYHVIAAAGVEGLLRRAGA